MHELAICQALVEQIELVGKRQEGRVTRVLVSIGPLSGVEGTLLTTAYPLACAGTRAEGSALICEETPVRIRCSSCRGETAASANRLVCGLCGDWRTELITGDELLLKSIEFAIGDKPESECAHV